MDTRGALEAMSREQLIELLDIYAIRFGKGGGFYGYARGA